jgi:hypothetical protein
MLVIEKPTFPGKNSFILHPLYVVNETSKIADILTDVST